MYRRTVHRAYPPVVLMPANTTAEAKGARMNGIMGNVKPGRSLRLIAATVAIVIAGISGTASAVNPHRPIITSMTPNFGPSAGGTTVTVEGSNFKPPMTATFAGVAATGCTTPTGPAGDQTFTCVTPASSVLGLVPVTI